MGRAEQTFIFLFILLSLASCGKKETIRISAVNAVTGAPYSGLKYTIRKQTSGGFQENNKVVEEGTLDENGRAVVEMSLKNASYELNIEDPGNLCYSNSISYTFTKNDNDFDFHYKFAECANLKRSVNNINCQGSNDYMILQTSNTVNSLGSSGWEFFGCEGFQADSYSKVPFGNYYFKWTVTRNGSSSIFFDTIYLSPNEQRSYEINY